MKPIVPQIQVGKIKEYANAEAEQKQSEAREKKPCCSHNKSRQPEQP